MKSSFLVTQKATQLSSVSSVIPAQAMPTRVHHLLWPSAYQKPTQCLRSGDVSQCGVSRFQRLPETQQPNGQYNFTTAQSSQSKGRVNKAYKSLFILTLIWGSLTCFLLFVMVFTICFHQWNSSTHLKYAFLHTSQIFLKIAISDFLIKKLSPLLSVPLISEFQRKENTKTYK